MAIRRVLVLIQVGSATSRRRQATPLSEPTNLNRTMKARAEGEVAADPLGDLSPFTRRACIFILPRVGAICVFGAVVCGVVVFFGAVILRHQR